MKEFLHDHSSIITKVLLNQFGAAFMGLMITAAASRTPWLMMCASCFAIFFYLFLLYNVIWEIGGQDRIRVDGGRAEYKPLTGVWVSLIANIPSIFLGILVVVGYIFGSKGGMFAYEWAGNMYSVSKTLSMLWNAMYIGVIRTFSPYNPLAYLLQVLPAVFVTGLGYYLGLRNRRIFGFIGSTKNKSDKNKGFAQSAEHKKNGSR